MAHTSERIGFDRNFLERVIDSIDTLAIIGHYTSLKKSGGKYKGLCPFHKEKTPSFTVDPDRGLFYCFGCSKGGDIFTFIMEKEALSFPEAVEFLAKEAGIPVPKFRKPSSQIDAMQQAVDKAHELYRKQLFSSDGTEGLKYLLSRGITKEFARNYGLGWSPPRWDFITKYVSSRGIDIKPFMQVGLLIEHAEQKTIYDRFRHGIVIPIRSSAGRLVAFAIRSLDTGEGPKYINSSDSPLYRKSNILFGLERARKSIRKNNFTVLVEGYFDVISLWQAGIDNVVASCGTAFTASHANILARFCDTVVIFYDGDDAGIKATYRAIESLLRQELLVKIARPPNNMDPDDVAQKWERQDLKMLLDDAPDWFDFSVQTAQNAGLWDSVEGKIHFADKIAPYIYSLGNGLMGSLYRKKLAEILGVSEKKLGARISKAGRNISTTESSDEKSKRDDELPPDAKIELDLLMCIIVNPTLCRDIVDSGAIVLYSGALNCISEGIERAGEASIAMLANILERRAMSYLTQELMNWKNMPTRADTEEMLGALRRKRLEAKQNSLRITLKEAEKNGEQEKVLAILEEISKIRLSIIEISSSRNRKEP